MLDAQIRFAWRHFGQCNLIRGVASAQLSWSTKVQVSRANAGVTQDLPGH